MVLKLHFPRLGGEYHSSLNLYSSIIRNNAYSMDIRDYKLKNELLVFRDHDLDKNSLAHYTEASKVITR
jgi:hypothetical protein